jgi:hypothetical protein
MPKKNKAPDNLRWLQLDHFGDREALVWTFLDTSLLVLGTVKRVGKRYHVFAATHYIRDNGRFRRYVAKKIGSLPDKKEAKNFLCNPGIVSDITKCLLETSKFWVGK